jgi:predicted PurR-regulated permease PerM
MIPGAEQAVKPPPSEEPVTLVTAAAGDAGSSAAAAGAANGQRMAMPLPTFLLFGIFTILLFYTLYFTGEVVLPIIFAMILYLVLQPAMRAFMRVHIPQALASILVICILFGAVGGLGFMLASPAASWVAKGPSSLAQLDSRWLSCRVPPSRWKRSPRAPAPMTG